MERTLKRSLRWKYKWNLGSLGLSLVIITVYDLLHTGLNLFKYDEVATLQWSANLEAWSVSVKCSTGIWSTCDHTPEFCVCVCVDKATDTKKSSHFSNILQWCGNHTNSRGQDNHMPLLLDEANDWQVPADLPDRRKCPAFIKDTGMRLDVVFSLSKQDYIFGRTYSPIWVKNRRTTQAQKCEI